MNTLFILALLIPLIAALTTILFKNIPSLRESLAIIAGVCLFSVVLSLTQIYLQADGETLPSFVLVEIMPNLPLAFSIEPIGLIFALVASFLWPITTLYAIGYMRGNKEENQARFFTCFALAITAAMGIALSDNLFTLFTFYEFMTIVTYPLVVHTGSEEARKSGRVYLGILMVTSIGFQLVAIIWTWYLTDTITFREEGVFTIIGHAPSMWMMGILLALFMYGIGKAALMPFHRWLPAAMVAPTPVSALLHAVAVVKAGVFSVVKIIVYIFGVEHLQSLIATDWIAGGWLAYIAGISILLASAVALRQDNLKKRLAYSTISQLSYITMATAILAPLSLLGAVLHIAAHAVGKITLFFAAGSIYTAAHKKKVSELDGIGRVMPWTMGAFSLGALSMIGIPPTIGFVSKWYMLTGAIAAEHIFAVSVIVISTLLNASYFLPIIYAAFFKPLPEPVSHGEAPKTIVIALTITAAGTILLFFGTNYLLELTSGLYFLQPE